MFYLKEIIVSLSAAPVEDLPQSAVQSTCHIISFYCIYYSIYYRMDLNNPYTHLEYMGNLEVQKHHFVRFGSQ